MELQKFFEILLLAVIQNVVPLLVTAIVGYVSLRITALLKKLDPRTLIILDWIVLKVVQAAEQSALIGAIENTAKAKKEWAVLEVKKFLDSIGLKYIDVDTISAAIEAAILKGLQKNV